ncbi:MAG: carbon dioxide concentrating mechanism protein [Tychonema bourrellyi B0820]|uniref:Carbon dioxide concentrating mechanism protein n=1 Tax=Tychonema bourrellyi FEM_GT703 TaxID=2040638 RepID=A0A2G4EVV4_9CYAN|nr:carbon dioxide concentrating mechanism protein [Tychonema bourrellyi]MDQ2098461.1 carbon dioxide concentrating mechanism protein [Tychonema bourrellyi B0820]PHX53661.1 carbon dioxide concentrating mechanism protein [Tychonema bourrellyi FEM_GT703]
MYLSPLQLSSNFQVCISGDVVVDEGAAIARGVILRADPGSRISIAAGACIGMGAIIHAREGTLEIGAGVILGAGVLIVGSGAIGANACIGAATTLINPCVDKMQILPAGSLIGDGGRQVTLEATVEPKAEPKAEPETPAATTPPVEKPVKETPEVDRTKPQTPPETTSSPESTAAEPPPQPGEVPTILYGQAHINRLLGTLFPYRQSFNKLEENGKTFSDGSE